ncbi:MAG: alpha-amylase, partial [Saprospiraceae bacterium]
MQNNTLLQFFHWYLPADGSLWNQLAAEAQHLKDMGIDWVWLPPAYKAAAGGLSVGYDAYDLYDLGEFDQRSSVRTKYGTKDEYLRATEAAHQAGLSVIADVVMNHKAGADEAEKFWVRKVNPDNRNEYLSDSYQIEGFTKFAFPGRQGKYSDFVWHWYHFSGVDYAHDHQDTGIFTIQQDYAEEWAGMVDNELGNYDYLMYTDIEFRNDQVREELQRWGQWFVETTGADGFRLDAIKHMSPIFFNEWLDHLRTVTGKPLFAVGEYWHQNLAPLERYLRVVEGRMSLFDAPLHYKFYEASRAGDSFDMRTIFDGTLAQVAPMNAVTLVDNHDSQPLQALESPVEHWFKPLAYALILLREQGLPCVFHPDLYGAEYTDKGPDGQDHPVQLAPVPALPALLQARRHLAYGEQQDYFDDPHIIGWTRLGHDENPGSGYAVILTNGEAGTKRMQLGPRHANARFVDKLGHHEAQIQLDENGSAEFPVQSGSVS